jgi:serine/threonine-protein kinase
MRPDSPAIASGRYVIGDEIASGGMATVHLGRMVGDAGFARTVAIKRLHPELAKDPEIVAMLIDEGRLSARIHHLNVVTTLDVVAGGGDLFVVMEYVHGESLSALIRAAIRRRTKLPPRVAGAIVAGALRGLHAAHEAKDARGEPLGVVHRDVSPQNILVGSDGVARVLDFGIAKAAGSAHVTQDGRIKGKFGYMPPEQLLGEVLDRRADIYAAGVVLWEALVGARLFAQKGEAPDVSRLLDPKVDPPSARVPTLPRAYDAVVLRALAREAGERYPTALAMAEAIEACAPVAPPSEVGAWVVEVAGELLADRAERAAAIEARLVKGVRDSLHLLEASASRVTRLDAPAAAGERTSSTERDAPTPVRPVPSVASAQAEPDARTGSLEPPIPAPPASESGKGARAAEPVTRYADLDPLPGRGTTGLWIGAAALGAIAIAGTLAVIASVPAAPASPLASIAPPLSAEPSATASVSATASAEPAEPPAVASASASAPPPEPSATASAKATAATKSAPRSAPRAPADACSPPFTIDAAGHKHYKRECLR